MVARRSEMLNIMSLSPGASFVHIKRKNAPYTRCGRKITERWIIVKKAADCTTCLEGRKT